MKARKIRTEIQTVVLILSLYLLLASQSQKNTQRGPCASSVLFQGSLGHCPRIAQKSAVVTGSTDKEKDTPLLVVNFAIQYSTCSWFSSPSVSCASCTWCQGSLLQSGGGRCDRHRESGVTVWL